MGNWPSNYKSPNSFSGFGGKVISNNIQEGGFGVTDAIMISGHRTVKALEDLYAIPTQILSSNKSNENTATGWEKDSLGQIWYVQDDNKYYRLINYSKHGVAEGWEEMNFQSKTEFNDSVTTQVNNLRKEFTERNSYIDTFNKNVLRYPLIGSTLNQMQVGEKPYKRDFQSIVYIGVDTTDNHDGTSTSKNTHALTYQFKDINLPGFTNQTYIGNSTYTLTGNTIDPDMFPYEESVSPNSVFILNTKNKDKSKLSGIVTDVSLDDYGNFKVTKAIPRNYLHGNITSYTSDSALNIQYAKNGENYTTVIPNASSTKTGVITSSTYAELDDIFARIKATPEKRTLPNPTFVSTVNVYKTNGTDKIATYTNQTSFNIEEGCKYTASLTPTWTFKYTEGQCRDITETTGDFGAPIKSTNASAGTYTYTFNPLNIASTTMTGSISKKETLTAVTQYGIKGLQIVNGYVKKVDGTNITSSNSITFSFNKVYPIIRWWGAINVNPTTWMPDASGNIKNIPLTTLNGLEYMGSDKQLKAPIVIPESQAKTDTNHKFFVYVYRASAGLLSKASTPGSNATEWFNTTKPFKIKVTSGTNGYTAEYYVIYSKNENALSNPAELTFA